MPIVRALNQDFFKTWSPEMAYVLGYFAADGSMIRNKRGACFIEFTSTDRILICHVKSAVGSNHAITKRERHDNNLPAYRIQFGSKEWFTDLLRLGFSERKSLILNFPLVPPRLLGHFVRGYFDGDGCAYVSRRVRQDRGTEVCLFSILFTSGSFSFLANLKSLLIKHGVVGGSLKKKNRGFELVFARHDSLAIYRLMYHTCGVSSLFLPRKREKLERGIEALGLSH